MVGFIKVGHVPEQQLFRELKDGFCDHGRPLKWVLFDCVPKCFAIVLSGTRRQQAVKSGA